MINQTEQNLIENWMWENFGTINQYYGDFLAKYYLSFGLDCNIMYFLEDFEDDSDYPDLEIIFNENSLKLFIRNHMVHCDGIKCELVYDIPRDINNLLRIISECFKFKFDQKNIPITNYQKEYDKIINIPNTYFYTPSSGIARIWDRNYSDRENNIYTDSEIKSIPYNTPKEILDLIIRNPNINFPLCFEKIDNRWEFLLINDFDYQVSSIDGDYLLVEF